LRHVTIGAGLTNLGKGTFDACTYLTTITFSANNSFYSSLNGVAFDKSQTTLVEYPCGGARAYAIPASVTSIGDEAFLDCAQLTNLTIPNSVTNIGECAFQACSGLTSIIIPQNVANLGTNAFNSCINLRNVIICGNVVNIGADEFYGCDSLLDLYFEGNAPILATTLFGDDNYAGNAMVYFSPGTTGWSSPFGGVPAALGAPSAPTQFGFLTNGNGIAIIGWYDAGNATIPASINDLPVTAIAANSFRRSSVVTVTIPGTITNIGSEAFTDCSNLTGVYFEGDAPTADSNVFLNDVATVYYCPGAVGWSSTFAGLPATVFGTSNPAQFDVITDSDNTVAISSYRGPGGGVGIPASIDGMQVSSIASFAFSGQAGITAITIPDGVASVGYLPFLDCTNLTAINVDPRNSNYSSVDGVIFDKKQRTLVEYPPGRRGSYTIPSSVASLGDLAFYQCSNLTSVTIPGSITNVSYDVFHDCGNLTNVTLDNGITTLGPDMFAGDGLVEITIPASVMTIAPGALECNDLTTVFFQGNAPACVDPLLSARAKTNSDLVLGGECNSIGVGSGV
jgi:hypothetical protein